MDDAELSRIRAARLAELQGTSGSGGGGGGKDSGNTAVDNNEIAAQRHAQLSQILAPEARDRLRRIALVKPDRASSIEELLLRMAKSGQIRQRVTEAELVGLLTEVAGQQDASSSSSRAGNGRSGIVNLRRGDDSDDDWN